MEQNPENLWRVRTTNNQHTSKQHATLNLHVSTCKCRKLPCSITAVRSLDKYTEMNTDTYSIYVFILSTIWSPCNVKGRSAQDTWGNGSTLSGVHGT